jgi:catechol 2,3-dioxygenase-like lactoylglutathione lyase family enzyme
MILHPDHITVAVRDADAAIRFFGLLGFVPDHVVTIDGGEPAAYMGMPTMRAEHITLVLEGADPRFEIQLLQFADSLPPEAAHGAVPSNHTVTGLNHIALRVDDIAATREHLLAHGVIALNDEMDYISRKLQFFRGPDGVTVELVEAVGD